MTDEQYQKLQKILDKLKRVTYNREVATAMQSKIIVIEADKCVREMEAVLKPERDKRRKYA